MVVPGRSRPAPVGSLQCQLVFDIPLRCRSAPNRNQGRSRATAGHQTRALSPVIIVAVVLATFATPARADGSEWIELGPASLVEGAAIGVIPGGYGLTLAADAPRAEAGGRYGMAESAQRSLAGPSQLEGVDVVGEVPPGATIDVMVRGHRAGRWTEWREPGALDALDGSTAVQVRVTLAASASDAVPVVRGVRLRAERAAVRVAQAASAGPPPTVKLWATRIGLVGRTTANGHVIGERDRFVALPSKRALNRAGARDYQVQLTYRGRTVIAPVWDVGPWNTRDDYWNEDRESFNDLPRWLSQAEAAFFQNHNGGRDGSGRWVTYPASIDLADGTFLDDLGMTDSDWVEVAFLWVSAPSPPPRPTPAVTPRQPPPTAVSPAPDASGAGPSAALVGVVTPRTGPVAPPSGVSRASAYSAPAPARRVYLPLVARNASGWTTNVTVQNTFNAPAEGRVEIFDAEGELALAIPLALDPFAAVTISGAELAALPDGFLGSAIVSADLGCGAVVTGERPGSDRFAYEGPSAGGAVLFAPLVTKDRDGWSTVIHLQNLTAEPAAVQVEYLGTSGGRWGELVELAPFGSAAVSQVAHVGLPTGFVGSAVLTSVAGQPVAAIVNGIRSNGAAMAYVAATSGSDRLDAPLLFKRYNGWDSAFQLFNIGPSAAGVMVAYRGGDQPVWGNAWLASGGMTTLWQEAMAHLPDGYAGPATVQAPPGARLVGVVSEVRAGTIAAMSYTAGRAPGTTLAVPLVARESAGWTSGIEVQNPNPVPVSVALMLYDQDGTPVLRAQRTVRPGETRNFYLGTLEGVPEGFQGTAVLQSLSGHPILAVVTTVAR